MGLVLTPQATCPDCVPLPINEKQLRIDKLMARQENVNDLNGLNTPENLWMSYLPGWIQGMNPVTWLSLNFWLTSKLSPYSSGGLGVWRQ